VIGDQACTGTQKVAGVSEAGVLVCSNDEGAAYTAGAGLTLTGTSFSVDPTDFNGSAPAAGSYDPGDTQSTGTTSVTLRQASLTVPGPGLIVVMGRTEAFCDAGGDAAGEYVSGYVTITDSATAEASTGSYSYFYAGWNSSNSTSVMATYSISAAGTYTYYLRGRRSGGAGTTIGFHRPHLVLFFLPN